MKVDSLTYNDFINIIRRRKWDFIVPCCAFVVTALAIAFLLPSVYMSTAKILIEEQEIPQDYVKATVTSYAQERVHTIKQRILNFARLLDIVNRLNLYQDMLEKRPIEQIISKMREDIQVKNVNVEVVNRRTGRVSLATIAFTLSYQSNTPEMAKQVTNLLASMFLEENLKIRKRQTTVTTQFLENEISKLEKELAVIEGQIAVFKEKYINELPSLLQLNIQNLQGLELKKEMLKEELLSKKEKQEYLQLQLANMPEASRELADQRRLEELEASLVNIKSHFTDAYPDVIKVKDEIAELKQKIALNVEAPLNKKEYLDNPAYFTLNTQLSTTLSDVNSLQRQITEYTRKEDEYKKRIETSLRVEEEYRALVTKRDSTQAKHNDLTQKLMEAKVSYGMEEEQKGERFTLIEPANYSETPFKPNRLAIVLFGFVAGFGIGTGMVALREYADHSIHDEDMLARATSFPVLGCIPEIITQDDIAKKRRLYMVVFAGLFLIFVGIFIAFNYFLLD